MFIKQLLSFGVAAIGTAAMPALASDAVTQGIFALSGTAEKVTAELSMETTGPLSRELLITFADKTTGKRIVHFDEELTQQLHVLATDSDFSSFLHEHPGKAGPDGRFRVAMNFPRPGVYHVFADAVPTGLGQQVVRFDVSVASPPGAAATPAPSSRHGSDGPYTIQLDQAGLQAGKESMLNLTVLKDGKPAQDLGLYLGVPAHAVFVGTDDLAYVHAHAMSADAANAAHGAHGAHGAAHDPAGPVPARMMLHAKPPHAGQYALWIQFMAGGEIRTVPFVVDVAKGS
ncbi:hypothetical protein [Stenotrophomonas rhizophila]|uniref:hypothetical protein n=1 Tax=Stenotrophomonas rhizophila TaxID=216778 RepID=UPI001E46214C|nr:hypothetical protein [Stenotrophomonas rhizophila]MCC7635380.1 hypothetical protein [Stenotrophomonas rhizophila]MCC7664391.1 hypothetical protein [Stenotrophomonas rhizophila]